VERGSETMKYEVKMEPQIKIKKFLSLIFYNRSQSLASRPIRRMAAPHVKVNRHGSISISRAALANGGWSPVPAPPPGTDFSTRRDDGQMSSAVDSLISALEGGQDDDASYEGISSLIEQMVQGDVAPGRRQQQQQFSSPAQSGAGTRGGKKSSQRGPAPLVLRSGPTPYELWEGRHPVQEEKRAVVLTDAERDEVTERLGRHAANSREAWSRCRRGTRWRSSTESCG